MILDLEIRIVQLVATILSIPVTFFIMLLLTRSQERNWPPSILASMSFTIVAVIVNLSVLVIYPESFQEVFFEDTIWWILVILVVGLTLHFAETRRGLDYPCAEKKDPSN